jgi:ferritin-like metal-binding protein YciE
MEKGIRDLLIDELHDILSSEEQIIEALPDMVAAAESPELKKAFESHLKETKGQVQRLEKIFKIMKVERKEKLCKATKGLIQECKEVLKDFKEKSPLRDAALISKAQRIEHYEISAYGTMRTFAKEIQLSDVAGLLQETLGEEEHADQALTKIAEGGVFKSGINHLANQVDEHEHKKTKSHASKS